MHFLACRGLECLHIVGIQIKVGIKNSTLSGNALGVKYTTRTYSHSHMPITLNNLRDITQGEASILPYESNRYHETRGNLHLLPSSEWRMGYGSAAQI